MAPAEFLSRYVHTMVYTIAKIFCIFFFLFLKEKEAKRTSLKNRFAVFRIAVPE